VCCTNAGLSATATANAVTWALKHDVNVHAKDANLRVILHLWEVSVISDAKGKISRVIPVVSRQCVFTTPESILEEFFDVLLFTECDFATDWGAFTSSQITVGLL